MDIVINSDNSSQDIEESGKILWTYHSKKLLLPFLFSLIVGVICLGSGIANGYDTMQSTSEYHEKANTTITTTTKTNYHITFGLGVAFIFLFLLLIYGNFSSKRRFFDAVKEISNKRKLSDNKCLFRINDNSIFFEDFEMTRDEKWSNFSSFKVDKNYLFLFRGYYSTSTLVIPIRQIKNNDLADLLSFLNKRLLEKK